MVLSVFPMIFASQVLVCQESAEIFVALSPSQKKPDILESTSVQDAMLMWMNNVGYLRMTLMIHNISTVQTGKRSFRIRKLNVGTDYCLGLGMEMHG